MKALLALSIIAVCLTAAPAQAQPQHDRWSGTCSGWWMGEYLTPAIWAKNPDRGAEMMRRLIVCEFGVNAPGQSIYAIQIAERESGLYPWSLNSSSGCAGIFQMMQSYWPSRAEIYLERWEFKQWPVSVFDPRANIEVASKMVGPGGNWGPWS